MINKNTKLSANLCSSIKSNAVDNSKSKMTYFCIEYKISSKPCTRNGIQAKNTRY